MRFRRLLVRDFRAVEHALVDFGPALNVLYGPNDLGKTTLAMALRAVLLLPAESTAHQAFVPWHRVEPPQVTLTFERDGRIWRVHKTFAAGSSASARLESSPDGSNFHEEERGRAVDRRLRELLRWGIEAPGGKGATRGLPESFLSHVLLAAQAAVPDILERTLGADRDASGRERLHEALSALAQDPTFKRVLEAAQAKVDSAFTPTGRRKTGQSSPFAPIKDQINGLSQDFERFSHQRRESEEVQERIVASSEGRLGAEARVEELEGQLARERAERVRFEALEASKGRQAAAWRALEDARAAERDLTRLAEERAQAGQRAAALGHAASEAAATLAAARALATSAERAVLDQTSATQLEARAGRRAELEAQRLERESELGLAQRLLELEQAVAASESVWNTESAGAVKAQGSVEGFQRQLAAAEQALLAARRLELAAQFRDATVAWERARTARNEASSLEQQAVAEQRRGLDTPPALGASLCLEPNVIGELRELESQIRVTEARLEVGLGATVRLIGVGPVLVSVDGEPEMSRAGRGESFALRARGRIALRFPGALELEAVAGDQETQGRLEQLRQRWAEQVVPLLEAAHARDIDQLSERVEAERRRLRLVEQVRANASALEARAREARERGAELEIWERRALERREALGAGDPRELLDTLDRLGPTWEATLRARVVGAERERVRAQAALERENNDLLRRSTRLSGLGEALAAARAARARALVDAKQAGGTGPVTLGALQKRRIAAESALLAVRAELSNLDRAQQLEAATARDALESASARLSEARRRHEGALAESAEARDGELTLGAQLGERQRSLAALDVRELERRYDRAQAEVTGASQVEAITAERVEATELELERARVDLTERIAELRRAEGALGHIGGDVALEREQKTREALDLAREQEQDLELDFKAYRLLTDTLRGVENEQGAHLGRALEGPLSERFARLTEGRYANVGLDAELGLQGIFVSGQARAYRDLSEGTQEQLATILRLCIAEQLETALVLDDHLAQTHHKRAAWFQGALREASERIQIVVITARPEDYLASDEFAVREPSLDLPQRRVRAVDLERVIQRAQT